MERSEEIVSQFLQRKNRLKELAKGRCHSIQCKLTECSDDKLSCQLIVGVKEGNIVIEGTSLEDCLDVIGWG
jgi:hypothetical protein